MNPLWFTIHIAYNNLNCEWIYRLQMHFTQPFRTGSKREGNYEWHSPDFTYNEHRTLASAIPATLLNMIKEASVACNIPKNELYEQFTTGQIALKMTEQGITVYNPYNKSKNKAQDPVSEPVLHLQDEASMMKDSLPTIDALPAVSDVFVADIESLI